MGFSVVATGDHSVFGMDSVEGCVMTDLRQAAQMALEALASYEQYIHPLTNFFGGPEVPREGSTSAKVEDAIATLRAALAEPEQEPVAWMVYTEDGQSAYVTDNPTDIASTSKALPLYTAPPQRPQQEPVGWLMAPYGEFQRNYELGMTLPSPTLDWRIPLLMGEIEQGEPK
jgi:hypothetical protein